MAYKGTKLGCGVGLCGAGTVHLDGTAVRSCTLPLANVGNAAVTTIEGMAADPLGRKLPTAWVGLDVPQCGYCQARQIMSASALLAKSPQPSDREIDVAISGNVCRCCSYLRIRAAIQKVVLVRTAAAKVERS